MSHPVPPDQIADRLLENGERFVTTERLADLLGVPAGRVSRRLTEPRRRCEIVSVTKGGWAPVPERNRRQRQSPMLTDYLDEMMRFMGHEYYMGYLAAANTYDSTYESHASSHIVTPYQHKSRHIGKTYLRFIRGRVRPELIHRTTIYGKTWNISTPEATIFDLTARPEVVFGLDRVATIIGEMITANGLLDVDKMVETAAWYPRSVLQRVGYMADIMQGHLAWMDEAQLDLTPLINRVNDCKYRLISLTGKLALATSENRTSTGDKWGVVVDHILDPSHKSRCEVAA